MHLVAIKQTNKRYNNNPQGESPAQKAINKFSPRQHGKVNCMRNKGVINALEDMKRQIEIEEWAIYCNDRGSGSAGVRYIDNSEIIDSYLIFAKTKNNEKVPHCNDIYYISAEDFDEEDNEVVDEILDYYGEYVKRDEVLGLVVCQEHYDMEYTFYMLHIEG